MIRVSELRKTYGERVAVDALSFEARAGEIFALLGPNGAGKTTTIHCIVGLLDPDHGTIQVAGHDVRSARIAARRSRLRPMSPSSRAPASSGSCALPSASRARARASFLRW